MPYDAPPDGSRRSLRCPGCGFANLAFASFCISCGEPLELEGSKARRLEGSDSGLPTFEPFSPQLNSPLAGSWAAPNSGHSPLARWETWIGLAVLILVIGYALYD